MVAVGLAVAVTGDLAVSRRNRRAGAELAQARAAAQARLVEVLDGRMGLATYGAGPLALAELREGFRATDGPRRRWSAREGAGQLITDLAAAGAVAAVLAGGAGLGGRPLSPAVLAFAALLTLTLFDVAGALSTAGPTTGQALAAWRRLTETSGLSATAEPATTALRGRPGPVGPRAGGRRLGAGRDRDPRADGGDRRRAGPHGRPARPARRRARRGDGRLRGGQVHPAARAGRHANADGRLGPDRRRRSPQSLATRTWSPA